MNLLRISYVYSDLDSSTSICFMEQQIESQSIPFHLKLGHNIPVNYNAMYIATYERQTMPLFLQNLKCTCIDEFDYICLQPKIIFNNKQRTLSSCQASGYQFAQSWRGLLYLHSPF